MLVTLGRSKIHALIVVNSCADKALPSNIIYEKILIKT